MMDVLAPEEPVNMREEVVVFANLLGSRLGGSGFHRSRIILQPTALLHH